jgi:Reverse transcriptase (RNA-dependent DNA polymerase)
MHSTCSPGRGMAVLSSKSIQHTVDADHRHHQWHVVHKEGLPGLVYVCNIHTPPATSAAYTEQDRHQFWDTLAHQTAEYQRRGHVILLGDMNAPTPPLPITQPYNSSKLTQMCTSLGLVNLTTSRQCKQPSHRSRSRGTLTRLDHVVCDAAMARYCTSYRAMPFTLVPRDLSDHTPLTCTFTFPSTPPCNTDGWTRQGFTWRPEQASMFARLFAQRTRGIQRIKHLAEMGDVDAADTLLATMQVDVAHLCGMTHRPNPTGRQRPRDPGKPRHLFRYRMTAPAQAARQSLKALLSQPGIPQSEVKKARKAFRKALKQGSTYQAYMKSQRMAESLRLHPTRFWRKWSTTKSSTGTLLSRRAWRTYYSNKMKCDPAADSVLRISSNDFPNRLLSSTTAPLTAPPTLDELTKVCKKLKTGTSSGLDGVPLDAFTRACYTDPDGQTRYPVLEAFLPILHASISTSRTPLRWRNVRLRSIFKRGDPTRCQNYRPISVSMSAYRVFASLVNRRLTDALESSNTLHDGMFGFRPGRSSAHAVLAIKHMASLTKSKKLPLFGGFMDLKSAFDTVSHKALLQALEACGAPPQFTTLVAGVYENCVAYHHDVTIDPVPIPIQRGIRQGCPLSPTLFNLIVNVIAQRIARLRLLPDADVCTLPLRCIVYADDIVLLATSHDQMKYLINELRFACHCVQFTIEPDKCQFMMFNSTSAQRQASPPFTLCARSKPIVESVVYLGLHLDNTCSSRSMMQHRMQRAQSLYRRACAFAATANIHHVLPLETVFSATVMSSALYGVEAWGMDTLPSFDVFTNDIQKLAARFLKQFLRLPSRTSNLITTLESGFTLVATHAYKRVSAGLIKAHALTSSPTMQSVIMDPSIVSKWRTFLTSDLGLTWELDQPPPKPGMVARHATTLYDMHIQKYLACDTRAPDCANRTTCDYLQHIWNKKYGRAHHVHTTSTVPCRHYRWFCRVRTLTFPAPAYTHHFMPGTTRTCIFGCGQYGDVVHYLSECPHTSSTHHPPTSSTSPVSMDTSPILSKDADPHIAAYAAMELCTRLKEQRNTLDGQP